MGFERFQYVRHVSIIIPQMFEDLDEINDKYEMGIKTEVVSTELKKDIQ